MKLAAVLLAVLLILAACGTKESVKRYVSHNPDDCAVIRFMCVKDMKPFSDSTGCGCEPNTQPDLERTYTSTDTAECKRIIIECKSGTHEFSDSTGCGCEKAVREDKAINCESDQRKGMFCTMEYKPVCGWNDPEKIQCIRYPCAQTYSNSCQACHNENVAYYTEGECPK